MWTNRIGTNARNGQPFQYRAHTLEMRAAWEAWMATPVGKTFKVPTPKQARRAADRPKPLSAREIQHRKDIAAMQQEVAQVFGGQEYNKFGSEH